MPLEYWVEDSHPFQRVRLWRPPGTQHSPANPCQLMFCPSHLLERCRVRPLWRQKSIRLGVPKGSSEGAPPLHLRPPGTRQLGRRCA